MYLSLADFHGNFILYINIDLLMVKFVWLYIILLNAIVTQIWMTLRMEGLLNYLCEKQHSVAK